MAQSHIEKNRLLPLHPIWRRAFDDLIVVPPQSIYSYRWPRPGIIDEPLSSPVAILAFNGNRRPVWLPVAMSDRIRCTVLFLFNFLFLSVAPLQQIGMTSIRFLQF